MTHLTIFDPASAGETGLPRGTGNTLTGRGTVWARGIGGVQRWLGGRVRCRLMVLRAISPQFTTVVDLI